MLANAFSRASLAAALFIVAATLSHAKESNFADARPAARVGEVVLHNFVFQDGRKLLELRLNYATWGRARSNAVGQIVNALLLLHGTGGSGLEFGRPMPSRRDTHPLLGPGGPFDTNWFYVIAPDAIGSGASSKPSDGLRMNFPYYDLSDMATATKQMLEELGVRHLRAVIGTSMGGREAWQFATQYPEFMDAVVPMIASPFPNAGRRALVDLLPQAIILNDPAFAGGTYRTNPPGLQVAERVYDLLGTGASELQRRYPTRELAKSAALGGTIAYEDDACDFLYQLRLNDSYDAWSQLDQVKACVFIVNMEDDLLVPVELGHNRQAANRLSRATYLELSATGFGHEGLMRSIPAWGPKLRRWLDRLR